MEFAQSCLKCCRHTFGTHVVEGPKIMMRMWMLPNKGEEHDSGVVILYGTIEQPDKKGKPRDAEKTTVGRLLLYGVKRRATPALVGLGNACSCTESLKIKIDHFGRLMA